DVQVGDTVNTVSFPLTVYRMVMTAGANRDFNSIHHDTEHARSTGAPDMYANVMFLQGMWERCVREFIGLAGSIRSLKGFRMKVFNTVGEIAAVKGRVERKWIEGEQHLLELAIWTENSKGVSVGPGTVVVSLPA
ncbi:MAG: acyl dehydratase, partial [Rhizobacter sp.]|nr:acyl dehydratase [Rhizobacter sp.]